MENAGTWKCTYLRLTITLDFGMFSLIFTTIYYLLLYVSFFYVISKKSHIKYKIHFCHTVTRIAYKIVIILIYYKSFIIIDIYLANLGPIYTALSRLELGLSGSSGILAKHATPDTPLCLP